MRPTDLLLSFHGADGRAEETREWHPCSQLDQICIPLWSREWSGWTQARQSLLSGAGSKAPTRANWVCRAPWSQPACAKQRLWVGDGSGRQKDCWRGKCKTWTISMARKLGVQIRRWPKIQMCWNTHWKKVFLVGYFPHQIARYQLRWVLTAAHCVTSGQVAGVRLGEH